MKNNFEPPDRLDRVEAILLSLAEGQRELQLGQRELQAGQRNLQLKHEETQRQIDVLLALHDEREAKSDREQAQAELDRREFRSTVESLLDILRDRFTSNGH